MISRWGRGRVGVGERGSDKYACGRKELMRREGLVAMGERRDLSGGSRCEEGFPGGGGGYDRRRQESVCGACGCTVWICA